VYVRDHGENLNLHQLGGYVRRLEECGEYSCGDELPEVSGTVKPIRTDGGAGAYDWDQVIAVSRKQDCGSPVHPVFYKQALAPDCMNICFYCGGRCALPEPEKIPGWVHTFPCCSVCTNGDETKGLKPWKPPVWKAEAMNAAQRRQDRSRQQEEKKKKKADEKALAAARQVHRKRKR
jgi:hypothetical protein